MCRFPFFAKWQSICVGEQCGVAIVAARQLSMSSQRFCMAYLAWTLTSDDTLRAYRPATDHFWHRGKSLSHGVGVHSSMCDSIVHYSSDRLLVHALFRGLDRVGKVPCHLGKESISVPGPLDKMRQAFDLLSFRTT
jgi:hypothetical protein